jgi:hypothetical protein
MSLLFQFSMETEVLENHFCSFAKAFGITGEYDRARKRTSLRARGKTIKIYVFSLLPAL